MSLSESPETQTVPRAVWVLAISIVAFSLLNATLLSLLAQPSATKLVQRGIRFLLTCGLAYFLLRGASWARWVAIVVAILAVVTSLVGVAVLPEAVPFYFRALGLVMAAFYGAVAGLLLRNSSVISHFGHGAVSPSQTPNNECDESA